MQSSVYYIMTMQMEVLEKKKSNLCLDNELTAFKYL